MSVLVLSGVIPGDRNVGGIILNDLLGGTPDTHFACYSISNSSCDSGKYPKNCTVHVRSFHNELSRRAWSGPFGSIASVVQYASSFSLELNGLATDVVTYGSISGVRAILQIIDTPALIALGPVVAEKLGIPLYSLVWDHPDYILRIRGWDRFSRRRMLERFRRTLSHSRKVAVVSREMAQEYGRLGAKECMILRHGFPSNRLHAAKEWPSPDPCFKIGFAGSMYAASAWKSFIAALDLLEWKVAQRPVTFRLMGNDFRLSLKTPSRVECLGWRDNEETLSLLNDCDLNYLPCPFEGGLSDLARFSFPTKLSTYTAAGVPIFVHAPEHSSIHNYYTNHPLGEYCSSLEPQEIATALVRLVDSTSRMRSAAEHSALVARNELNREVFLVRFAQFLDLERGWEQGN